MQWYSNPLGSNSLHPNAHDYPSNLPISHTPFTIITNNEIITSLLDYQIGSLIAFYMKCIMRHVAQWKSFRPFILIIELLGRSRFDSWGVSFSSSNTH